MNSKYNQDVRKYSSDNILPGGKIKYKGVTHYENSILLGTAPDITSLDQHTKTYLKQNQEVSIYLHTKATSISLT